MAVTHIVTTSSFEFGNRIDAELYQTRLKVSYNKISKLGFEIKPLKSLCIIRSGTTPSNREDGLEVGPILFKTTDVRNGIIKPNGCYYRISNDIHQMMLKTKLHRYDVLMNIVGATLDVIGRTAFIDNLPEEANITQAMVFLRSNTPEISPGYLFAYLNTVFAQDQVKRFARPTGQYNLNLHEVGQIRIVLLPISKQVEISDLIISAARMQEMSEEYYLNAQKLIERELGLDKLSFQKPVGYSARFSELEKSRRLDAEYFDPVASSIVERISTFEYVRLGVNCIVANGFPWNSNRFFEDNSGEPVVRIRNIRPSHIEIEELSSIDPEYARKIGFPKAKKGDIVVGMDGIKYFYASLLNDDCYVNQRVAHLTWNRSARISPEYATFIINNTVGQAQLLRDMTVATTVGHITNRDIINLLIPIVSHAFHDQITSLVKQSIEKKIESKQLLQQAKTRVEQVIEEAVRK